MGKDESPCSEKMLTSNSVAIETDADLLPTNCRLSVLYGPDSEGDIICYRIEFGGVQQTPAVNQNFAGMGRTVDVE